jgi:hypothetical protein
MEILTISCMIAMVTIMSLGFKYDIIKNNPKIRMILFFLYISVLIMSFIK